MDDPATTETFGHRWLLWTYSGVDHKIPGNGGDECLALIPNTQKAVETVVLTVIAVVQICYVWPRLRVTNTSPPVNNHSDTIGRRVLLMIMCLTFGAEIGFKLASRQMIWILNQCHVVTMIQIYLLVAPPSKLVTGIFRVHIHCLNGAAMAMLFPILNTRHMPFEVEIYFIQHAMMFVIPAYLIRQRGAYTPEPLGDYSWIHLTIGILLIYHWMPLQFFALISHVNVNNMMCPAVSDPFHGRWYRIAAAGHQALLILFHGKTYVYVCSWLFGDKSQNPSDASSLPEPSDEVGFGRQTNGWSGKSHRAVSTAAGRQNMSEFGDPILASMEANGFAKLD